MSLNMEAVRCVFYLASEVPIDLHDYSSDVLYQVLNYEDKKVFPHFMSENKRIEILNILLERES